MMTQPCYYTYLNSLTRVKYRGTVYAKEMTVVKTMTNDTPELHEISEIMTASRKLYFVLSSLQQVEYWSHFHAYTG